MTAETGSPSQTMTMKTLASDATAHDFLHRSFLEGEHERKKLQYDKSGTNAQEAGCITSVIAIRQNIICSGQKRKSILCFFHQRGFFFHGLSFCILSEIKR